MEGIRGLSLLRQTAKHSLGLLIQRELISEARAKLLMAKARKLLASSEAAFVLLSLRPPGTKARAINDKMLSGFSEPAIRELESLIHSLPARHGEASYASWLLARRYGSEGRWRHALEASHRIQNRRVLKHLGVPLALLQSRCLLEIGDNCEAERVVKAAILKQSGWSPNLTLELANVAAREDRIGSDESRLALINEVFERNGALSIRKRMSDAPLTISNLTSCASCNNFGADQLKVSIIMPAYNSGSTIEWAIRGIREQTWRNLELIIVDDASQDETWDVIHKHCIRDSRIIPIRHNQNQGAYAARNTALDVASGDFVTVHDADDWSHPEKIERQARALQNSISLVAVWLDWVRATEDLHFVGTWQAGSELIQPNISSLMFRRCIFGDLGYWDTVRCSADREFLRRLEKCCGKKSVRRLERGLPLSLGLSSPTSLTATTATHVSTARHGLRREYDEAFSFWHELSEGVQGGFYCHKEPRAQFPVPNLMLSKSPRPVQVDILFIADWNCHPGAFNSAYNYVLASNQSNFSVGIFHWPDYTNNPTEPLNKKIRKLAHDRQIQVVVAGETVKAKWVVVCDPAVLNFPIDKPPSIRAGAFLILVNGAPAQFLNEKGSAIDRVSVRDNLWQLFGTEGTWIPTSNRILRLMSEGENYPARCTEVWHPLVNMCDFTPRPQERTCETRASPVIGRHAPDHPSNWPTDKEKLLSAYCAEKPCRVHLLGGARCALSVTGFKPTNWRVYPFDSILPKLFLQELDFFVNYQRGRGALVLSRSTIEAIAAGVPVILPPSLEEIYGEAALYAEAKQVWPLINQLWRNPQDYAEQVHRGYNFLRSNCGWEQLRKRLSRIERRSVV